MMVKNDLTYPEHVERWGVFELAIDGSSGGNPFCAQTVEAVFTGPCETVTARGFYDGNGVYRVRFMPSFEGAYRFTLTASLMETVGVGFTVDAASAGNTGHFAYDDGTPYDSIGTTCYV